MEVFKVKNNKVQSIELKPFKLEKDIQNLVENNTESFFDLEFVCSEFSLKEFRIDTLCFDNENNSFVIIEYKKGSSYSVIDQGYSYLSMMLNNKSDFIIEYNEKLNRSLKRNDIDWSQSKIIFVSPSFNSYQKNSVNFADIPFELWEIKRFSDNTVVLNQQLAKSKESIKSVAEKNNNMIKNVNKEVKVYTVEDLLNNATTKVRGIWDKISTKLESLDLEETKTNTTKFYVRLSTENNIAISYFHIKKDRINIGIVGGSYKKGGAKSKNFFVPDDFKNLLEKKERTWSHDNGGMISYSYEFFDDENIGYILDLVKAKYEFLQNK